MTTFQAIDETSGDVPGDCSLIRQQELDRP
jgi:hypothetical protein